MLKWRLSEDAQTDMSNIRFFTKEQWGITQSSRYIKEIREKIELLVQNPLSGADRGEDLKEGIRSILVGSHIIYYAYDTKILTVWAVLHQSMMPVAHLRQRRVIA
jgi:toxin ParE1/3/4